MGCLIKRENCPCSPLVPAGKAPRRRWIWRREGGLTFLASNSIFQIAANGVCLVSLVLVAVGLAAWLAFGGILHTGGTRRWRGAKKRLGSIGLKPPVHAWLHQEEWYALRDFGRARVVLRANCTSTQGDTDHGA